MTCTNEPTAVKRFTSLADALYFGTLGLWIGLYVMMGVAAGTVFKVAKDMQVTPGVEPFNQPPFAELEAHRIVGGFQFGGIFSAAMGMMTVLALVLVAAYGFRFTRGHWQGMGRFIAGAALVVAVLFFGLSRMQGQQVYQIRQAYYTAVNLGETKQIAPLKQAFDEAHEASSSSGKGALMALAVLFVVSLLPAGFGKKDCCKGKQGQVPYQPVVDNQADGNAKQGQA